MSRPPHRTQVAIRREYGLFASTYDRLRLTHPEIKLVGVDLTPQMLSIAQDRLTGRASLAVADAQALPLQDDATDVLVSSSVFHYLPEPAQTLAEWRRVLRPGGRLVITDWCRDFATIRLLDLVLRVVDRAHGRTWSTTELHTLLTEAGFIDVDVRRHRQGWFWGMMAATAVG
ncbi:MAG: methyltransferase domain-containing protein [Dehalococcoidia bacterium]